MQASDWGPFFAPTGFAPTAQEYLLLIIYRHVAPTEQVCLIFGQLRFLTLYLILGSHHHCPARDKMSVAQNQKKKNCPLGATHRPCAPAVDILLPPPKKNAGRLSPPAVPPTPCNNPVT